MTLSKNALAVLASLVAPSNPFALQVDVASLGAVDRAFQELQQFVAEQQKTQATVEAMVESVTAPATADELRAKLWPDFDALT